MLLSVAVLGGIVALSPRVTALEAQARGGRGAASFVFEVRSLDGRGNNRANPAWGAATLPYRRVSPAAYADATGSMPGGPRPRYVSNRVFNDTSQNLFSARGVTQWAAVWGQFLDHTFGLARAGSESVPIPFDPDDPLEAFTNDLGTIPFRRDAPAVGTRSRDQVNTVSSYIDGWAVYGGSEQRLEWLRAGPVDGDLANSSAELLLSADRYLPSVGERGDPATAPGMQLVGRLAGSPTAAVVAGDVRANENIALTAVHTLFAREHNRIVAALPAELPEQQKFEIARRVVGAAQQYITYTEFLPALGVRLAPYRGYRPDVDATLTNEFATVGYRAHSMIHGEVEMELAADRYTAEQLDGLRAAGVEVETDGDVLELAVPLNVAFGNPGLVPAIGLGGVLAGLAGEAQYANDEQIDNQLRSVLFQVPVPGSAPECRDGPTLPSCFTAVVDLGAIDIQRGRDHGIPPYNGIRLAYGLAPKTSFAAITGEASEAFTEDPEIDPANPIDDPDLLDFVMLLDAEGIAIDLDSDRASSSAVTGVRRTTLASRLKALYGSVDQLDAFVGMVAEAHVPGTELGELQLAMWKHEFERLRDGDRFLYANDGVLRKIEKRFGVTYRHTLAELILLNTDVEYLQPNVFVTG